MKIYAGNLADDVTEEDLTKVFKQFGKVTSVTIAVDSESGKSKGFAYIEMKSKKDGQSAIAGLHATDLKGNALSVNKAGAKQPGAGAATAVAKSGSAGGKNGFKAKRSGFGGAGGSRPNRSGQRGS